MKTQHYVTMIDRFMSGWGHAEGKKNRLVISCNSYDDALTVKENAENRSDMTKIEIVTERPIYDENKYFTQHHGVEQGDYKSWFKKDWFKPTPKMTKRQVENAQRNFTNLAKIFTEPTGAINQRLHDSTINERLMRFVSMQKTGLTAKQIEDFTFKLTDAEKLSILSKASNKAPLRQEYGEEMQRLFHKVYGEKAYMEIFGNRNPPEAEDWVNIWDNK